jgi:hypothetical protein
MKRIPDLIIVLLLMSGVVWAQTESTVAGRCMTCHKEQSRGLYNQWYESSHATHQVTCIDCHGADRDDPDAFEHYDAWIATLVTPKDCGECHPKESEQMSGSYHARAGEILESNDAYLAHTSAGLPVAITGCESCHGAKIEVDESRENKLSMESWPNNGIGRIHPDGSKGSCNACHVRHLFSREQARQPESCSKCHLGPDHPQKEVYEESKHGNTYFTNTSRMNLAADRWVVGQDYYAAPTCATCHMSATDEQAVHHDLGRRIAWTLRPPISTYKENHTTRRARMKEVCSTCHGTTFVDGHFYQFDAVVRLYNDKFARPATRIINRVWEKDLLDYPAEFANELEWTYWELWHHEGRRARHGASMMGPDYTWWHGMYEVVEHFYLKFVPQVRDLDDPDLNATLDSLLQTDPLHSWVTESTESIRKRLRSGEIQERYRRYFKETESR